MASFTRGTTPTIRIRITKPTDFDMTNIAKCTFKIVQVGTGRELLFENPVIDAEAKTFSIHLTQEESLSLQAGTVEVQVKGIRTDGNVFTHDILKGSINRILDETIL